MAVAVPGRQGRLLVDSYFVYILLVEIAGYFEIANCLDTAAVQGVVGHDAAGDHRHVE